MTENTIWFDSSIYVVFVLFFCENHVIQNIVRLDCDSFSVRLLEIIGSGRICGRVYNVKPYIFNLSFPENVLSRKTLYAYRVLQKQRLENSV